MTFRAAGLAVAASLALAACAPSSPPERRPDTRPDFATWRAGAAAADAEAYAAFLAAAGVADVVPLAHLLRTGRRWQRCGAAPFAVPPRADWPAMVPTLRLLAAMRHDALLPGSTVVSVYRDAALNTCEGGSARSRHRANAALDLDLDRLDPDGIARLCAWWRHEGERHAFGLGFYSDHQIHVDTTGHRTWGTDHTRRTSLCTSDGSK